MSVTWACIKLDKFKLHVIDELNQFRGNDGANNQSLTIFRWRHLATRRAGTPFPACQSENQND
jgi:hypothetical protein